MTVRQSQMRVKLGLFSANTASHATGPQALATATLAEQLGLESLWVGEHIVIPGRYVDAAGRIPGAELIDWPDPLVWLAFTAAATQRIKLATGVSVLPLRNPVVMAKQIATLDALSGGRVILGVGVGWLAEEFEAVGVPFSDRGRRHDDYLAAMRTLWSQDKATTHNTYANFDEVISRPKPANRAIPIVIGGSSARAARRAAHIGDGYLPETADVDELRNLLAIVHDECATLGRNPQEVELTVYARDTDADSLSARIEDLTTIGVSRVLVTNLPEEELHAVVTVLANRFDTAQV
jgi:probable F420-dependent oxidoreductase